jgi:hypothetical protein
MLKNQIFHFGSDIIYILYSNVHEGLGCFGAVLILGCFYFGVGAAPLTMLEADDKVEALFDDDIHWYSAVVIRDNGNYTYAIRFRRRLSLHSITEPPPR